MMDEDTPSGPRQPSMLRRLTRTTSFRFALITVSLFMVSVMLLGAFSYRATIGAAITGVEDQIDEEFENLQKIYQLVGLASLRGTVKARASSENRLLFNPYSSDSLYILIDSKTKQLPVRDLEEVPSEALTSDGAIEFEYRRDRRNLENTFLEPESFETRYAIGRLERFYDPQTGELEALIFLARDISDLVSIRMAARDVILTMALGTLVLALLLAFFSSRSFLVRIDRVNRTAEAVRAGDLSRRVPLSGAQDEFDSLAQNLNAMLDQIERLMDGMRQVSDNIAHDLRSPLTRIRNRLDTAITKPDADTQDILHKTAGDVDRLLATFNALLSITRIEAGEQTKKRMQRVDLISVVNEVLELYEPAAEEAGFDLVTDLTPAPEVLGSRELLSQALANLLDNAFKYGVLPDQENKDSRITPRIEIKVAPRPGGGALLSVADNGPGVPASDRARILNRFVRLEQSRSTQGSGLGLSMVSAIISFHDGNLTIGDGLARPAIDAEADGIAGGAGAGLGVRIAFPVAPKTRATSATKAARPSPGSDSPGIQSS
ncbi:HAMP domain-containing sensor histidine kinase [Parvularcula sp. IMCC14364]|uniref:sensor histidine kinase n=1 Tax=Parvularcula sp. IMCC14364 TaxID=3067902 RepID=UPI002742354B|nr:HAMP domain-containing sensor histidine kinase [Parvularcula sp. IMCC14364]